jgi:hypothetical protein
MGGRAERKGLGRREWAGVALALLSTVLSAMVISHLPLSILAGAGHDDAWFWKRAESIGSGAWLGEYDQHTLIKGVGYPLFLLAAHGLGLPVVTAQALLHGGAALLAAWAIYRLCARPGLAVAMLVLLQWHPAVLSWARVLRDCVVSAQVLLVFACLIHYVVSLREGRRGWGWMAGAGLVAGWFWSTREDGIWLLPGLGLLLGAALLACRQSGLGRHRMFAGPALMLACFGIWPATISLTNQAWYGQPLAVEVKQGGFAAAMSALQRVHVGDAVPFVPVPRQARVAIYEVSPAFARLRPVLEDPANPWMHSACALYASACGDYGGGWFMWALRDAVATTGGYANASTSERFYRQLAADIEQACAQARLRCESSAGGLVPSLRQFQWARLPSATWNALRLLAWNAEPRRVSGSHLDNPDVAAMWRYVGRPYVPETAGELGVRVIGWARDANGRWIRGACQPGETIVPVERRDSPDIAAHFNDPEAARNRFVVRFPAIAGCALVAEDGTGQLDLAAIDGDGRQFELDGTVVYVDKLVEGVDAAHSVRAWPLRVKAGVERAYAAVLPALGLAGFMAFAWSLVVALRRRRLDIPFLVAMAAWCMLAGRVALLVLVDISSFPALTLHYLQPAFTLFVVASICSLAGLPRWCDEMPPR